MISVAFDEGDTISGPTARIASITGNYLQSANISTPVLAGGNGSLRVAFGDGDEFLVLRDFLGGAADLDGALALLEHVTSNG